ncbi:MAG: hypothetical protein GZ091_14885, partial [Paludibacter sp.]|nr:hypothetical protein [Paludibacter sp.]
MSGNKKFQNKYRIPSARWAQWDYGSNATYFITICTQGRLHYFGEIVETQNVASLQSPNQPETQNVASLQSPNQPETQNTMNLSELGIQAQKCAIDIPLHFTFVTMDTFIVMPNHVHLLFTICKPDEQLNGENNGENGNDGTYGSDGSNGSNGSNDSNDSNDSYGSYDLYGSNDSNDSNDSYGANDSYGSYVETQNFASLQPITDQPITDQPITDQPITDQPITDQP